MKTINVLKILQEKDQIEVSTIDKEIKSICDEFLIPLLRENRHIKKTIKTNPKKDSFFYKTLLNYIKENYKLFSSVSLKEETPEFINEETMREYIIWDLINNFHIEDKYIEGLYKTKDIGVRD